MCGITRIVLAAAVLIGSFFYCEGTYGQCADGQCRRPVMAAVAAPPRAVAKAAVGATRKVVHGAAVATAGVVRGAARAAAVPLVEVAKVVALPVKAVKQCASNSQQRRCERGPIFPRLHARRCH